MRLALINRKEKMKENMKAMRKLVIGLVVLSFALSTSTGFADWDKEDYDELLEPSQATIDQLIAEDPNAEELMKSSHSFIVMPTIKVGGIAFAGAHGKGLLYQDGDPVALVKMNQFNLGAELGRVKFSEVIYFETADAFKRFIDDPVEYSARAEAIDDGDIKKADKKSYINGVMVVTFHHDGHLYGASLSGQKYHVYFKPTY